MAGRFQVGSTWRAGWSDVGWSDVGRQEVPGWVPGTPPGGDRVVACGPAAWCSAGPMWAGAGLVPGGPVLDPAGRGWGPGDPLNRAVEHFASVNSVNVY
jgi:hypothetical protein